METYDLAVIGGGASGLAAALAAAESAQTKGYPVRVAVLEKNPRVGKKLLTTGNGRCNLTNMHLTPDCYHGDVPAAGAILRRFPPGKIVRLFRSEGLFCRELDGGRVYPYSLQASSVLNTLRRGLESCGADMICDFPVNRIENIPGGFAAVSGDRKVKARKIVVATGGKACPQSGSDGSGYALLHPFRHSITELRPALVQIRTDAKRTRPLKGVRCIAVASLLAGGKTFQKAEGEVQFTENSLSGICIFELSRLAGESCAETLEISLDLAPEYHSDELARQFHAQAERFGSGPASALAEGMLNRSLASEVVKTALDGASVPAGLLSGGDCAEIAAEMKDFRFPVLGTLSWQNAQVTAGGVPLAEVDSGLQSRFCQGLYLCGELLNVDGGCGGFNLQWAWASGITAGLAAAEALVPAGKEET